MAYVISSISMKGGVGKTTSVVCLGMGLADREKKVLLVDLDAQGSLSIAMGCDYPERQSFTMAEILQKLKDTQSNPKVAEGIFSVSEQLDYLPANRRMALVEQELVLTKGGEHVLGRFLDCLEESGREYDYILLDCPPSLGMMTANALAVSDGVLIPTQAEYLAVKGMEQVLQLVLQVQRKWNPKLKILGILPTMVNHYTRDSKSVLQLLDEAYGEDIGILPMIPYSVRAKEISSQRKSIYQLDRGGKVASGYLQLVSEILALTTFVETEGSAI